MGTIILNKVVPTYLEKEKIAQSSIWNNTIEISKGEMLQIVAPSGSGKSSLMHFLYGLRKDYIGEISIKNQVIHKSTPEEIASLRAETASILFQDLRLFPDQTGMENIEIKRILKPFHSISKIEEMAALLGVSTKLKQKASTCSYGEQQRLAIIRSLQQPFDFLLLDEPFSHLDEQNRRKAMSLIIEEAKLRNAAVILADLKEIDYFPSSRILHL